MFADFRHSLAAKIIIILSIVLFVVLSMITFLSFNAQKAILLERGLKEANDIGDVILTGIRYPMLKGDQDIIQLHFEHFRALEGIESIHLLDHKGIIKRSTDLRLIEQKSNSPNIKEALIGKQFYGIRDTGYNKQVFERIVPIPNEGNCVNCHGTKHDILGALDISLDWEPVANSIQESRDVNIAVSFIGLVIISLSVIFMILRIVVHPIMVVEKGMQKVSEGDLNHKLPVKRQDEIGNMSAMFNTMTQDISTSLAREKELRQAEQIKSKQLEQSLSLINATLESTADGIFVVSNDRRVVRYNQQFLDIWRIDEELFKKGDERKVLEAASKLVEDKENFYQGVERIYADPELEISFTVKFKDGRIIDIVSKPQKIGFETVGRVWSCRDITLRKNTEEALKTKMSELERFNRFVVGREIKMKELKEQIFELRQMLQKKEDDDRSVV
jgi:PAS domain-containing protein